MAWRTAIQLLAGSTVSIANVIDTSVFPRQATELAIDQCPGYVATNVKYSGNKTISADLNLAGAACNTYGTDVTNLKLLVEYQTVKRLHVKIYDADEQVYQVPEDVVPSPPTGEVDDGDLVFSLIESPFSFAVSRAASGELLFNTSGSSLIFESQYLRLRTSLPEAPHLYGLGEHTDPFMLNTTDYTRTLWSRDAYTIPTGTNLYGNHPVYFDHRGASGTHAVFLRNSNGMDIKINNTADTGQYLEYNTLGGVFDFYFVSGPTPKEVAVQYSEVVGKPALQPYWGFGFHQCRYGMQDVYEVAAVVANYSVAGIPLETMWTDIDYMDFRHVFTLDPLRFPLDLMRQLVDYLHAHNQHYVVMVDPAVAYLDYPAFNNGADQDAFLKVSNGSIYKGVVWPGVTAFPDWFHPNTQGYWDGEFDSFFDADTGVDIDALWIDMNEASNFCTYPCADPEAFAVQAGDPPQPPAVRLGPPYAIPGFPDDLQPQCVAKVSFNVNASTYFGENIVVVGSAVTLGQGNADNSAPLAADDYPIWSATIDLPPDTVVSYEYVRSETDGSYIYEATNRTIRTGPCNGTTQIVNDVITTAQGTPSKRDIVSRDPLASYFRHALLGRSTLSKHQNSGDKLGLPGRDLINPPYKIQNSAGSISNLTLFTDLIHYNGLAEYDTHNLYGTMMSAASRDAMLSRRPTVRPLIITRSTFAGAGRQVGHWLGDNFSDWAHYLISIAEMLEFGALFQIPMVGSDVCGFAGTTNELLCARWATLGAFTPFYRNHDSNDAPPQEYYRWPTVAEAAKNAIATRYQLLDYLYTAFYHQNQTGEPLVSPMFFEYPEDTNTFPLQYQYFYGPSILVAPVTTENSTVGSVYLPDDIFYDFYTYEAIRGDGSWLTLDDVPYTTIPLYIKGGSIVPIRAESASTTTELRAKDFVLIVAPGLNGTASGSLYLDEGNNLEQPNISEITFSYVNGTFSMGGTFGYDTGDVTISSIVLLGVSGGSNSTATYGTIQEKQATVSHRIPLTEKFGIKLL
ncbi:hypothetical protein AAFC00_003389 [Neodothiora populina]|uniref:CBM20 domain-containing protein n=1 Tax=Neodothiora populina TaxID=2781224 RepID=A0ABR3PE36_9PEZI